MARARRVVLGGLGVTGLLLIGLRQLGLPPSANAAPAYSPVQGREAVEPSPAPARRSPASDDDERRAVAQFVELLTRLRSNDTSVVPAMRELAETLCGVHERCDGQDILAFYVAMSPDDRTRGMEEQQRFDEIEPGIRRDWNAGLPPEQWAKIRDGAIDVLQGIAGRSLVQADVAPGACALSLCVRLETERVLADRRLTDAERHELIATASEDAAASLEAFERCGMIKPQAELVFLLGHLESAQGHVLQARRNFEDCLVRARRFRQPDWEENAILGLLCLAKDAGDLHETASLLNELASLRPPEQSWVLAREQADLLLKQDLAKSTSEFLLSHRPERPRDQREWHVLLGTAYLRQGELARARDEYALADPLPFSRDVALGMAHVDLKAGQPERVLEQLSGPEFSHGINPYEKTLALQLCGQAALSLGRFGDAADYLDDALEIGGDIQARLAIERDREGTTTSVVGEKVGLHALALLAQARVGLADPLEAARVIENWQSRTLRGANGAPADVSTENLLAWASSTELGLVTWVVGSDSSIVAHVSPDGSAAAVPIARGRKSIESGVRRVHEAVLGGDAALAERLSTEVAAEVLPAAIASRIASLSGSKSKRLLVLVHGPIERLPIEFLFRDGNVVPMVLPGLPERDPGEPLEPSALSSWTLLGNPVDAEGRPLLPGAREELVAIAGVHRTRGARVKEPEDTAAAADRDDEGLRIGIGSGFDRRTLTSALQGNAPVHIATHLRHGCGRDTLRLADVGLELSGGDVFCARAILDCRPRLPLAVLSACETAEGRFVDAEGLQGVSRAFLESGTRNLLVTLWPVEDQAARRFAHEFHRSLLTGERPSQAAASARSALRSSGFPAADWAAFRLIGRD